MSFRWGKKTYPGDMDVIQTHVRAKQDDIHDTRVLIMIFRDAFVLFPTRLKGA